VSRSIVCPAGIAAAAIAQGCVTAYERPGRLIRMEGARIDYWAPVSEVRIEAPAPSEVVLRERISIRASREQVRVWFASRAY
jgi:hypothetical protein